MVRRLDSQPRKPELSDTDRPKSLSKFMTIVPVVPSCLVLYKDILAKYENGHPASSFRNRDYPSNVRLRQRLPVAHRSRLLRSAWPGKGRDKYLEVALF